MRHKLQFLVNDHVIPYNMTVYQAIRQFAMAPAGAGGVLPGGGLQVSEFCLPSSLFFPCAFSLLGSPFLFLPPSSLFLLLLFPISLFLLLEV